jgi:hypothetical protein
MHDPDSRLRSPQVRRPLPAHIATDPDMMAWRLDDHDSRLTAIESSISTASQPQSGPWIGYARTTSGQINMGGISYIRLMILAVLVGITIGKADFLIKRIAGSLG